MNLLTTLNVDVLFLFLLVVAVWRLTSLLVQEEGPFNIFFIIRYLAGVRYGKYNMKMNEQTRRLERGEFTILSYHETVESLSEIDGGQLSPIATNVIASALICTWCTSIYSAIFFVLFLIFGNSSPFMRDAIELLILVLSLSGLSIFFNNKI